MLSVRRWQRYGTDRLYVQDAGRVVGIVDLLDGSVEADNADDEALVRRAAAQFLRSDVPELLLPTQRPGLDDAGLTPADELVLAAWLGGDRPPVALHRAGSLSARLDQLADEGWTVLHDLPVGLQGSLLPHLLIGTPGVFAVTERGDLGVPTRVEGQVLIEDDRPVAAVRTAVLEARRVRYLLLTAGCVDATVRPVVVVRGALEGELVQLPHATVVARADVPHLFRRSPERLTPAAVAALSRAATRPATWRP